MKKIVFFLFGLLLTQWVAAQSNCEDPILANFECNNTHTLPGTVTRIVNSFSGGINTTPNIGQYSDNGTEAFDALVIDYGSAIDLSTNNRLRLKLYSPDRSIQILAKLEGGTAQEIYSPFSSVGVWQEFTFDFSSSAGNGNSRVVLFFNPAATTGNTTDLYYFDDLEWIAQDYAIWLGTTSSDWDTTSNWDTGSVPTTSVDVLIPDAVTKPVATGAINVRNMTIQRGSSLTVNGAVTNAGTINVESGASFIAKTSVSGNIAYKRYLDTDNWYLVSPSMSGETIQNFIAKTSLPNGSVNASNLGLAFYENDGTAWNYQNSSSTGAFVNGEGVSVKLSERGIINFTGSMITADFSVAITDGASNEFNLLGNPFPSYIPVNTSADGTNNLLTVNDAELGEKTIWLWDQATNSYITLNNASSSRFLAPGQGFFVDAKAGGGNFSFTEAMQSHETTDVFNRSTSDKSNITLSVTDGTKNTFTEVYYMETGTLDFDNGFDSSLFSGVNSSFAVYSQLVSNSEEKNLAIQTLPNTDLENTIIPIGLKAVSGSQITFSATSENLQNGLNIYLEDRATNTFTLLDASSNYSVNLTDDANGIGRFYLRTSSTALSTSENTNSGINVFTENNNLHIVGLQNEAINLQIYNILGAQVLSTSARSESKFEVSLNSFSTGLYIVKLKTSKGTLTKKIIID